jgi:hypothetical protein
MGRCAAIDIFLQFELLQFESSPKRLIGLEELGRRKPFRRRQCPEIDVLFQFEPASECDISSKESHRRRSIRQGQCAEIAVQLQFESRPVEFRNLAFRQFLI